MTSSAKIVDLHSKRPLAANDARLCEVELTTSQDLVGEPVPAPGWAARLGRGLFMALCFVTFHLLYWPRPLIERLGYLVVVVSLVALAVVAAGMDPSEKKTAILWGVGAASLGTSVLLWSYDVLLMKLQSILIRE